ESAPATTPDPGSEATPPEASAQQSPGDAAQTEAPPAKEEQAESTTVVIPAPDASEDADASPAGTDVAAGGGSEDIKFIKGDLIYPGTRRILSRYDHVGVALGAEIIDNELYT